MCKMYENVYVQSLNLFLQNKVTRVGSAIIIISYTSLSTHALYILEEWEVLEIHR